MASLRNGRLALASLLCGASFAWADAVPSTTLPDALAQARAHWPSLQAARARLEAAARDVDAASAQWLPTVGVMAEVVASTTNNSTTTTLSSSAVDLPRIGATPTRAESSFVPAASTLVAVGARQTLYDFGRITAQTAAASALRDLEREHVRGVALGLDLEVKRAFYAVLAAHAVLDESQHAFERAKAHRDFARQAVEAQVRPPIELTRAEADFARADVGRIRAESGLRAARLLLAALVGVPEQELDAEGSLTAQTPLPDAQQVREAALVNDPALAGARAQTVALEQQAALIAGRRRPTLLATASFSGRSGGAAPSSGTTLPGAGFLPGIANYDLGVVLSWPLLDVAVRHQQEAAEARARAAQQDVEAAKVRVSQRALQLAERARVADVSLVALENAASAARANAAQADARFKAGLGTSLEIADAELLRTDAEINVALGRFEALTARAALETAMAEEPP